jgi:hypothetical protein
MGVRAVLLSAVVACALQRSRADVSPAQKSALLDLFNSTNGAGWNHNDGWGTATDACTWFGVKCLSAKPYELVSGLALKNNSLHGTIPESIGYLGNITCGCVLLLSHLQWQSGHRCASATHPGSLALTVRRLLDFSNNQLSGSVPDALANCVVLKYLILSNNDFSDMGELVGLESLQ